MDECTNAEIKQAVEGIEKAFKHITTFTFPHPKERIANATAAQKTWFLPG